MARDAGDRNQLCGALTTSADILIERREFGEARADAEEGSQLATAEWVLATGDDAVKPRAKGWLAALSRLQAIDATLRDKAGRLLGLDATEEARTLPEIESDVLALLDGRTGPS